MEKPSIIVVAVDVGTMQISAVMASLTNGVIVPIAAARSFRTGVKRGVVIDKDETAFGIREAINMLQNKTGHIVQKIYVSLGGQSLKTIDDSYTLDEIHDNVQKEHIEKLRFASPENNVKESDQIKQIYPQSYIIDGYNETPNPQGYFAKSLTVKNKLLVFNKSYIENLRQSISKAHLTANIDNISLLTLANKMLTDIEKEKGGALVDMGAGTFDLIIYHQRQVRHAVSIPLGANLITRDIASELNLNMEMAEKLVLEHGQTNLCSEEEDIDIQISEEGFPVQTVKLSRLTYIIRARMDELLSILSDQITVSSCRDILREGIVLTGNAAKIKGCIEMLHEQHSLKARIGTFPHEEDFGNRCSALSLCLLYQIDSDCTHGTPELEKKTSNPSTSSTSYSTPKKKSNESGLIENLSRFGKKLFKDPHDNDDLN